MPDTATAPATAPTTPNIRHSNAAALSAAFRSASETLRYRARNHAYQNDPVLWIRERLHSEIWSKQREIANSIVENKKTAVKSCHGVGKTYLAALVICWWIDVHADDEVMVVTTAPTDHQVKKILWQYIRRIHRTYGLRGTVSEAAEWKSGARDFIAYGRKPADANISAFQGAHIKYLLAVIDEAGGVPQSIWDGVDSITTMDTNRILAIGNPDDPGTEFGNIFLRQQDHSGYHRITISAFDSPNFTDEHDELPKSLTEQLVSRAWVEEKQQSWGVTDRRYKSKVLGEFPEQSFDALFTAQTLARGQDATILPAEDAPLVLGCDVARFGTDLSVVASNVGGVCGIVDSWAKLDTVETARRIHDHAIRLGAREVRVDGVGVGAGVVDQLTKIPQRNYQVIEVNGGAQSPDPTQWYNYRAFLYDNLRDLMHKQQISIPEPTGADDPAQIVQDELGGVRYRFLRGAMLIESKDEIRKRGGKSPDYADALTYAAAPFNPDDPFASMAHGDTGSIAAQDVIADELMGDGWAIAPY